MPRYKDSAALKAHGKFPEFKEMNRTLKKEG
jgi:quinol monooxygenase YgiN